MNEVSLITGERDRVHTIVVRLRLERHRPKEILTANFPRTGFAAYKFSQRALKKKLMTIDSDPLD